MSSFVVYIYHIICHLLKCIYYRAKIIIDKKKRFTIDSSNTVLIISHNMGGGTAAYLNSISTPDTVIIKNIEYIWHLCYRIEHNGITRYIDNSEMKKILRLHYKMIILNSFVKMTGVFEIIDLVICNKKHYYDTKMIYLVHDYHSICPNFNLIINSHYCGLKCSKCNYRQPIVYGSRKEVNLLEWRRKWKCLFEACNEIRCFSESSKSIMSSVFPEIIDKISIIPHKMKEIHGTVAKYGNHYSKIGFFGTINNEAKGIYQTRLLLDYIDRNIQIYFVGSENNEIGVVQSNVHYIGRYNHDDLLDIINNNEIECAIIPSVAPETFSFLVSELIMINIPVLGFNIGAQGEKIRKYKKGILFDDWEKMGKYINHQYLHNNE